MGRRYMVKGAGKHRGKGKTKDDLLIFLLKLKEPTKTSEIRFEFKRKYKLKNNKNIYNHLVDLEGEGLIKKNIEKNGLDAEWYIPKDFEIAKRIYNKFLNVEKIDLLKSKYFQDLIDDIFLENAIKSSLDILKNKFKERNKNSIKFKKIILINLDTKKNIKYLSDSIKNKSINKKELLNQFIPFNKKEDIKEILKCSPSALHYMFNMGENDYLWRFIIAFSFSESKNLMEDAKNNNVPTINNNTPIMRILESLFISDLLKENILQTEFVDKHIKQMIGM